MTEMRIIGKNRTKIDALAKVTGAAKYGDDMMLPRMVYGKLLRSTQPHAHIRGIDISRAQQLPGVLAVITGHDLPTHYGVLPNNQDETALAMDKVRYIGEPVAAVAAFFAGFCFVAARADFFAVRFGAERFFPARLAARFGAALRRAFGAFAAARALGRGAAGTGKSPEPTTGSGRAGGGGSGASASAP